MNDRHPTTLLVSDLDGVLCDSVTDALRWVWDHYGTAVPRRAIDRYAMEGPIAEQLQAAGVDVDAETVGEEMIASCWSNAAFYRSVRPHVDYWHALLSWISAGRALQLVTRRPHHTRHVTLGWLAAHGIDAAGDRGPLDGQPALLMKADKVAVSRAGCEAFERVVLIDDALHHCERVAAGSRAEVWMPARPWNAADPLPAGVTRLDDTTIAERLVALDASSGEHTNR